MYPVPTVADLSAYSGRAEDTYTGYANAALLQSTIRFTMLTEVTDPSQIDGYNALSQTDMQTLATQGILALADYIYLQFPYQQVIASPLNNETIGSYSYAKTIQTTGGTMSRMAPAALELNMEKTGIALFDLAVQYLAKRTIAQGVFHDGVSIFDLGDSRPALGSQLVFEDVTGRRWVLGPEDRQNENLFPAGGDINAEVFPQDPGV